MTISTIQPSEASQKCAIEIRARRQIDHDDCARIPRERAIRQPARRGAFLHRPATFDADDTAVLRGRDFQRGGCGHGGAPSPEMLREPLYRQAFQTEMNSS